MNIGKMSESGLKQAVFGTLKKFDMGRNMSIGADAGEFNIVAETTGKLNILPADTGKQNSAGMNEEKLNIATTDGQKILVSSAETFGDDEGIGALAVIRACNSLAAAGGRAEAIVLNISVKKDDAVTEARRLMGEAASICKALGIRVIHGNTIITHENHVSVTVLGACLFDNLPDKGKNIIINGNENNDSNNNNSNNSNNSNSNCNNDSNNNNNNDSNSNNHNTGDKNVSYTLTSANYDNNDKIIIMIGSAGLAGAKILSHKYKDVLTKRLTQKYIDKANVDFENLCIITDAQKIYETAGDAALHDVSSGGVFGALWELCERENVGCRINVRDIPINQVTIEICEILDISPYELMGDGALVAIVPDTKENRMLGTVIGVTQASKDRIIVNNSEKRFLEPNRRDSFYEVKV